MKFFFSRFCCQQKERRHRFCKPHSYFPESPQKESSSTSLAHKPRYTEHAPLQTPRGPHNPGQVLGNLPKYAVNHLQASGLNPTQTHKWDPEVRSTRGEASARTLEVSTLRNWQTHLGSDSSRAPPPAQEARVRARALRRTQSYTLTDAVTYVMHMENPSPRQLPPRPPHHSWPPAPG